MRSVYPMVVWRIMVNTCNQMQIKEMHRTKSSDSGIDIPRRVSFRQLNKAPDSRLQTTTLYQYYMHVPYIGLYSIT